MDRNILEKEIGAGKYLGGVDEEYARAPEIVSVATSPDKEVPGPELDADSATLSSGPEEKPGSAEVIKFQEREIIKRN